MWWNLTVWPLKVLVQTVSWYFREAIWYFFVFSTFHEGAKEYESETVLKRKKFEQI